ncbi:MAG TPA: PDZ domain-containing protein [Candidatus Krumholzibacteria bacterium]|nr:PDZ domain-containing protein [Candidatus Krumholzibacteria bacterium]HPD70669.1 PDZ domain-containing protein [Candidatus Krumholzibacteria bacterium]HRY39631.1 PDZ domain-containing protein [Candidatus Krumholzibacteria bacterium]
MSRQPSRVLLAAVAAALVAGTATAGDVYLGITMSSLSASMSRALQLDEKEGVLVDSVVDDSPASAAGLAAGDVIVAIEGDRIDGTAGLSRAIRKYEPEQKVAIEILRDGKRQRLDVTLGERPERVIRIWGDGDDLSKAWKDSAKSWQEAAKSWSWQDEDGNPKIVIEGLALDGLDRGFLGIVPEDAGDGKGVEVAEVIEDGPAESAGIEEGDIIIALDDEEIGDSADLHDFLADTEAGQDIEVRVLRDGKKQEFALELAEAPDRVGLAELFMPHDSRHPAMPRFFGYHGAPVPPDAPQLEAEREDMDEMKRELEELREELAKLREELEKKK